MEVSKQKEIDKLNKLKEELFYPKFLFRVSYRSFDDYFKNIFKKANINSLNIFKQIAEGTKKYITYNEFYKAYLKYKENKTKKEFNQDLLLFFDTLLNEDLIKENSSIENKEECPNDFSQIKITFYDANNPILDQIIKNMGKIEIMKLKDKTKIIKGIIIQSDKIIKHEFYPKKLKYSITLEKKQNLDNNEQFSSINYENNSRSIKMAINKEMATEIFGGDNENNNSVSILGFKFFSDKLKYIYLPSGERCSFEEFCKKFSFFQPKIGNDEKENYNMNFINKIYKQAAMEEKENRIANSFLGKICNLVNNSNEKIIQKIEVTESELKINNSENDFSEENAAKEPNKDLENSKNENKNENNQVIKPKIFLKNKYFQQLKQKLVKIIYNDFYKEYDNDSMIPSKILNNFVPEQVTEREGNDKKEEIEQKNKIIKLNGKEIKINDKNESEDENPNSQNNNEEKNDTNKTIINSDANELWKDLGYDSINFIINQKKNIKQKESGKKPKKTPEENWRYLNKRIKTKFGITLFQTIRRIIIALNAVNNDNFEHYDLKEKIKIYKILTDKDNERIIKFLSKYDEKEENRRRAELIIEKLGKTVEKKKVVSNNKLFNVFVGEKNFFIEKISKIKDVQGFLFCYQRKRQAIIEEAKVNYSIMKTKIRSYKEILEKSNISKLTTFHGQDNLDDEIDPNFIPEKTSLCPLQDNKKNWKLPQKVLSSDLENWEIIKWKKIENMNIFFDDNSPNIDNIRQGEFLGDCYFLSALGSLCHKNNYLRNIVYMVKSRQNKTIYSVKFNLNGKWKYVLIDNYFPFVTENDGKSNFCFGSSFKKELWVSLLEKAWAKINGCYARIGCGGKCYEAFDVLTGAYSELIKIRDINGDIKEILWNKLKDAKDNNYDICAGTRQLGLFESVGLISGHAYSVLDIYYFNYEGRKIKLIKLRNPWGEKEFNGQWSDNSLEWNDELRKLVNFEGVRDEGIFYMSFDDFIKYFSLVEILKIKSGYEIISSCKIKKSDAIKCQIIRFEINEEKKHLFINLYQKNPRIVRKNGTYFPEPVKSFIILAKEAGANKLSYITSISDTRVHLGLEATLDKGNYYIFCDVNYRFVYDEIYGYNITIYSQSSEYEIKLENITNNFNGKKRAEILNSVIIDYFEKNQENDKKIIKVENNKDIIFYRSAKFNEDFPFIFFILKNPKDKKGIYFSSKLEYNNTKNVCIYNNYNASEFDNFILKEINEKYTVLLFMGYELSDNFVIQPKFYETKQSFKHYIFSHENTSEDENFKYYISFIERKKGYIFGIKKISNKVFEKINFKVIGMNIIDPKYNDGNNDIYFKMSKKDEEKIFNLRLNPDSELCDYFINY